MATYTVPIALVANKTLIDRQSVGTKFEILEWSVGSTVGPTSDPNFYTLYRTNTTTTTSVPASINPDSSAALTRYLGYTSAAAASTADLMKLQQTSDSVPFWIIFEPGCRPTVLTTTSSPSIGYNPGGGGNVVGVFLIEET